MARTHDQRHIVITQHHPNLRVSGPISGGRGASPGQCHRSAAGGRRGQLVRAVSATYLSQLSESDVSGRKVIGAPGASVCGRAVPGVRLLTARSLKASSPLGHCLGRDRTGVGTGRLAGVDSEPRLFLSWIQWTGS